jgi:hypothetical protein
MTARKNERANSGADELGGTKAWRSVRTNARVIAEGDERVVGYRTIQVVYQPFDQQKKPFSAVQLTVSCNKEKMPAVIAIDLQVGGRAHQEKNAGVGCEAQGPK